MFEVDFADTGVEVLCVLKSLLNHKLSSKINLQDPFMKYSSYTIIFIYSSGSSISPFKQSSLFINTQMLQKRGKSNCNIHPCSCQADVNHSWQLMTKSNLLSSTANKIHYSGEGHMPTLGHQSHTETSFVVVKRSNINIHSWSKRCACAVLRC